MEELVGYISIIQVCELLGVSERTARELVKKCKDIKSVKTSAGSVKMLYNINEIRTMQQQQQLAECNKINSQAQNLTDKKPIEVVASSFMQHLDKLSVNDKEDYDKLYLSSMAILNKMMLKAQERIEQTEKEKQELTLKNDDLQKDKNELEVYKQEIDYIYNERYKSREIRAKINRVIRDRCMKAKRKYQDYYIEMYKKYDRIHNFAYKDNYFGYLDIIQARGHLKEFYEIIIHS